MSTVTAEQVEAGYQTELTPKPMDPLDGSWDGLRWMYAEVSGPADPSAIGRTLTQWGANGWELCTMLPFQQGGGIIGQPVQMGVMLYFKRPKAAE